jgi:hypothetical protein
MGDNAIRAGVIVVYYTAVEYDTFKPPDGPLELKGLCVDDVDAPVRAIGQIVFGAVRIDPADVE